MMISALAKATDTTKDTLRHYDQLGLLIAFDRQAGSRTYREYSDENIERIEMIRLGKFLGFTLKEIAEQIQSYYAGGISLEDQVAMLEARQKDVREHIERLGHVERYLTYKIELLTSKEEPTMSDQCLVLRQQMLEEVI